MIKVVGQNYLEIPFQKFVTFGKVKPIQKSMHYKKIDPSVKNTEGSIFS
jgi:hypothetical protein